MAGLDQVEADAERTRPDRFAFWVRFGTTFVVASAISFLHIGSNSLPLHLLKVVTVGAGTGLVVARFGDRAIIWVLRLLWWV